MGAPAHFCGPQGAGRLPGSLPHGLFHRAEEQGVEPFSLRGGVHGRGGMRGLQHVEAVEPDVVRLYAGLLRHSADHDRCPRLKDVVQLQMRDGIARAAGLHQNDAGVGRVVDLVVALRRGQQLRGKGDLPLARAGKKDLFSHGGHSLRGSGRRFFSR